MKKRTNHSTHPSINDIWDCLEDAQVLARQFNHTRRTEKRLFRAFTSLARDEAVGFLAYVIWKGRGQGLSDLRSC